MCRPVSRDRSTSACTAEPSRQGLTKHPRFCWGLLGRLLSGTRHLSIHQNPGPLHTLTNLKILCLDDGDADDPCVCARQVQLPAGNRPTESGILGFLTASGVWCGFGRGFSGPSFICLWFGLGFRAMHVQLLEVLKSDVSPTLSMPSLVGGWFGFLVQ